MFVVWWNDGEVTNFLCARPAGAWVDHKCRAGVFDSRDEAEATVRELKADAVSKGHPDWAFGAEEEAEEESPCRGEDEAMSYKRPQVAGSYVTTPMAATMIQLLGLGGVAGGVALSRDETQAIAKLYGFKPEPPHERPPKPVREPDPAGTPEWDRRDRDAKHKAQVAAWENWTDPRAFHQAGADRNMIRHAEHDGLRLVAWLAKHVPAGDDPLKTLVQAAIEAGWDVSPEDVSWVEDDVEVGRV